MDIVTLALAKKYTDEKCGGLPIVDIGSDTIINAFMSGEAYPLNATEIASFESARNIGNAIIVRFETGEEHYVCAVCSADYSLIDVTFACELVVLGMKCDVRITNNNGQQWTVTAIDIG